MDAVTWVPTLLVILGYHALAPLAEKPYGKRLRLALALGAIALILRYLLWRLSGTMLVARFATGSSRPRGGFGARQLNFCN